MKPVIEPTAIKNIDPELVEFNRSRYKLELAQAIYDLMRSCGIKRAKLAELLGIGYENRSRITHILSGEKNLQADTFADILLVLGRTPHVVMGVDFEKIRMPVDEASEEAYTIAQTIEAEAEDTRHGETNEEDTQWVERGFRQEEVGRIDYRKDTGRGREEISFQCRHQNTGV